MRKVVKLWPWGDGLDPNHWPHMGFTISDQLFNCYNLLTVCSCEVKPVWWLSVTVALSWPIWHPDVAVSCLLCPVVSVCTLILCSCCSPHPNTMRTATIHCYTAGNRWFMIYLVCCCCSLHPNTVQTATINNK